MIIEREKEIEKLRELCAKGQTIYASKRWGIYRKPRRTFKGCVKLYHETPHHEEFIFYNPRNLKVISCKSIEFLEIASRIYNPKKQTNNKVSKEIKWIKE